MRLAGVDSLHHLLFADPLKRRSLPQPYRNRAGTPRYAMDIASLLIHEKPHKYGNFRTCRYGLVGAQANS
jgi:hypothetical protein